MKLGDGGFFWSYFRNDFIERIKKNKLQLYKIAD